MPLGVALSNPPTLWESPKRRKEHLPLTQDEISHIVDIEYLSDRWMSKWIKEWMRKDQPSSGLGLGRNIKIADSISWGSFKFRSSESLSGLFSLFPKFFFWLGNKTKIIDSMDWMKTCRSPTPEAPICLHCTVRVGREGKAPCWCATVTGTWTWEPDFPGLHPRSVTY